VGPGGIYDRRLPDGADDPESCVHRLDAWVKRHKDVDDMKHRACEGIERETIVEQVSVLLRLATAARDDKDPVKRRAFLARRAELLKRIAKTLPDDPEAAEDANQLIAQLDKDA
jgi:hypothetical protein